MQRQQGWLFPIMVVAAGSMIAFGCVGIAAITGHLQRPPSAPAQFDEAVHQSGPLVTANAHALQPGLDTDAPASAATTHSTPTPVPEHERPVVQN